MYILSQFVRMLLSLNKVCVASEKSVRHRHGIVAEILNRDIAPGFITMSRYVGVQQVSDSIW